MRISTEKIIVVEDNPELKAYVTLKLEDCFLIRDVKIIMNRGRLFVAMPSIKLRNGRWVDLAHPIDKETRDLLEKVVLDGYAAAVAAAGDGEGALPRSTALNV